LGNPIEAQAQQRGISNQRPTLAKSKGGLQKALEDQEIRRANLLESLLNFAGLDQQISDATTLRDQYQPDYMRYLANQQTAEALPLREARLSKLLEMQKFLEGQFGDHTKKRDELKEGYDEAQYESLYESVTSNQQKKAGFETRLELEMKDATAKQEQLASLLYTQEEFEVATKEVSQLEKLAQVLKFVRESIRKAGPQIARRRVQAVSYSANQIFRQILLSTNADDGPDGTSDPGTLNWDHTYDVTIRRSDDDLVFKQLSGGEKMSAAIAIRIALLSQMTSNLRLLFLDEPTANLDDARRNQLADQITRLEGLNQLFVITHDDAFERAAHHVLQVFKHNDISMVNVKS
jgi:exonuclease SbcC